MCASNAEYDFKELWFKYHEGLTEWYDSVKDELKDTAINITCYDREGKIVKRVTSTDPGNIEDPDSPTDQPSTGGNDNPGNGGNTSGGNSGGHSSNEPIGD